MKLSNSIKKILLIVLCNIFFILNTNAEEGNLIVKIKTNYGDIKIKLFKEEAPLSTANFIKYVKSDFYKDTIFHRVIPGFVIQGGGFTKDMLKKSTFNPIENESDNGLENLRGTLSMARTMDPNSATSQFFINLKDNASLDGTNGQAGYTVFAKVIEGMDVVDEIAKVKTGRYGMYNDVPVEPVIIENIEMISEEKE